MDTKGGGAISSLPIVIQPQSSPSQVQPQGSPSRVLDSVPVSIPSPPASASPANPIMASSHGHRIPPPTFSKGKSYDLYKRELLAWKEVTTVERAKQGIVVALSLPEVDCTSKIREKVFESLGLEKLNGDDGLTQLLTFLDKNLGKDDLEDAWLKYEDFDDVHRVEGSSISEYISTFDQKYDRVRLKGMVLPPSILAFKLLKSANLSKDEKLLIMTGLDFSQKEQMYDDACKSLRKFRGDTLSSGASVSTSSDNDLAIKVEPTYFTNYGQGRGYRGRGSSSSNWRDSNRNFNNRGFRSSGRDFRSSGRDFSQRGGRQGTNPHDKEGNIMRCNKCDSTRHFFNYCPHKSDGMSKMNNLGKDNSPLKCDACESMFHLVSKCPHKSDSVYQVVSEESQEHVILFTGYDRSEVSTLGREAHTWGVLDSACSSTVCGDKWLENYISNLNPSDKEKVSQFQSDKVFRFGGETVVPSSGGFIIPACLAGKQVSIRTDMVKSNIPLLFSREALKGMGAHIDYATDTGVIFGNSVDLNFTSSGHHCISLMPVVDDVNAVDLHNLSSDDLTKTLLKLHRQFGHPSKSKLIGLLKDAGIWKASYNDIVSDIYTRCRICKEFSTTPARPVVCLSLAKSFNEKVAMDLKSWKPGRWILYMIDMYSRFTLGVFIDRKKSSTVIDQIIKNWIKIFGVMQGILTDNGGEFNSDELRDVASLLNIQVSTTGAESPFQNGLCERVHAVTDMILCKLEAQYPKTDLDILLAWTCMAKNSLQMYNGFSSNQLVFGHNPNLPNILNGDVPALENLTHSEVFARHLNVLHSARKEFIRSESDERLRRALRHKIRVLEHNFHIGDKVFYKREGRDKWIGPGTVLGQDGKVVFLRHGGAYIRVSSNRVIDGEGVDFSGTGPDSLIGTDGLVNGKQPSDSHLDGSYSAAGIVSDSCSDSETDDLGEENIDNDQFSSLAALNDIGLDSDASGVSSGFGSKMTDSSVVTSGTSSVIPSSASSVVTSGASTSSGVLPKVTGATSSVSSGVLPARRSLRVFNKEHNASVYLVSLPRKRHNDPECVQAKELELAKLRDFDVYEEIPYRGQTCISTRWILWEKGEKEIRARLVARGFEEDVEVAVDSPTVSRSTIRIILAIAVSHNWQIKTTDIKSAFLQGSRLDRDVFLTPPREANALNDHVWKLKKCLYGLNDAARKFYDSVVAELLLLGCVKSNLDPSLFFKIENGVTCGIIVSHIDDFLHAGDAKFDAVISKLCDRFVAGRNLEGEFKYVGYQITQKGDSVIVDQDSYLDNVSITPISAHRDSQRDSVLSESEQKSFRSLVGSLNWVVQGTRPDLAFYLIDLSTKFSSASVVDLTQVRRLFTKSKEFPSSITFSKLGKSSGWRIIVFSDASHANLSNGTGSCIGYIVFVVDADGRCCPITWKSGKARRVVKSTIAAEAMALLEGMEEAIYLRTIISEILCSVLIPIICITDHKGLVEAIYSTKLVEDKRLRVEIAMMKENLSRREVHQVRLCSSADQLADCLTKKGVDGRKLLAILQQGQLKLSF